MVEKNDTWEVLLGTYRTGGTKMFISTKFVQT